MNNDYQTKGHYFPTEWSHHGYKNHDGFEKGERRETSEARNEMYSPNHYGIMPGVIN